MHAERLLVAAFFEPVGEPGDVQDAPGLMLDTLLTYLSEQQALDVRLCYRGTVRMRYLLRRRGEQLVFLARSGSQHTLEVPAASELFARYRFLAVTTLPDADLPPLSIDAGSRARAV